LASGDFLIPEPLFPTDYDNDHTLFRVKNESKSRLSVAADEKTTLLSIVPASPNKQDPFPSSGFVTIDEEMIYYGDIEKDHNGKTKTLLNCIRGIESKPCWHPKNSLVVSNVVAQQHNRLVKAIINLQNAIEEITSRDFSSETDQIVNLRAAASPFSVAPAAIQLTTTAYDNDACPDVDFIANVIQTVPNTTIEYCVRIYGNYLSYRLDFGDGNYTTTEYSGTYDYAPLATVNPVVTVTSTFCCITQHPTTTIEGCNLPEPAETPVPFTVLIPPVPEFPSFTTPLSTGTCPGPIFSFPPIITPELSISSISFSSGCCPSAVCCDIPSVISIIGCNIPSVISAQFPSNISVDVELPTLSFVGNFPSIISFANCCNVPSVISFEPSVISFANANIPSVISFVGDIPSIVSFVGCCDFPSHISVDCCDIPSVISFQADPISIINTIPSTITLIGTIPPTITVDWGNPPTLSCVISFVCPTTPQSSSTSSTSNQTSLGMADFGFDGYNNNFVDIPINQEVFNIPSEIKLVVPTIRDINLRHSLPEFIELKAPETIKIAADDVPREIFLKPADNFPEFIELRGPQFIEIKVPDDLAIPLVYKGDPIPLDLNIKITKEGDVKVQE
jgi:PKD repeat protein